MATKTKVNRSELVRNILHEIGADVLNPPEGWKDTVLEKLGKHEVSPVMIYQIRRNLLKKDGVSTKKGHGGLKAIQILKKIGAISNNPPEGWFRETVRQLKDQKLELADATIYNIRKKELKKAPSIKFETVLKIKNFADSVGGIKILEEAIGLLRQLTK